MSDLTLFSDECIQPLLEGNKGIYQSSEWKETTVQLVADNMILITNANNETLVSSCSPLNNKISGNALITLDNCEMNIHNHSFNVKDISPKKDRHGLFYDNLIELREVKQHSIEEINNIAANNTRLLQHVHLKQFNNGNQLIILFTLAAVTLIRMTIIGTLLWKLLKPSKCTETITLAPVLSLQDLPGKLDDRGRLSSSPPEES